MTLLDSALAGTLALLLIGAGVGCIYLTLLTERPDPRKAPWLSVAAWWVGQALAWALLLVLAGGLFGLAARTGWRLIG